MKRPVPWALVSVAAALSLAAWRDLGVYPDGFASLLFLEQAGIVSFLVAAAATDLRERIIPNGVCLGIAAMHIAFIGAAGALCGADVAWLAGRSLLGLLALGGGVLAFTLAFELARKAPALGGGDVKLLAALGFAFGWERGMIVLLAACIAFVFAVAVSRVAGRVVAPSVRAVPGPAGNIAIAPDTAHPFAPALAIGVYLVVLAF